MEIILPNSTVKCQTLVDILRYRASSTPNKVIYTFLSDGEGNPQTMTYAELDQLAKAIAATLQNKQITPGDRAILICPPGLEIIAAFFGCLYAGVIAVPTYPPENIKYLEKLSAIIDDTKPKVILSETEFIKQFKKLNIFKTVNKIPLLGSFLKRLAENAINISNWDIMDLPWIVTDSIPQDIADFWQDPLVKPEQIAFLQYTSGSTAKPKGVVLLHKTLLNNFAIQYQGFGFNANDILASWLPPYHDMGLIGSILQPLFCNIPCYLIAPYHFLQKPLRWLQLISHYKATVSGGPDFAYEYCAKKISNEQKAGLDLSHWQVAFNGAEPIRAKTMERFYLAFKECGLNKKSLYPCYGLAETALYVSSGMRNQEYKVNFFNRKELRKHKIVSVKEQDNNTLALVSNGIAWQEIVIVNPETNKICDKNEIGEIWIHSSSVAQGYWNKEKESQETFHAHLAQDESKKNYLRTGDVGFIYEGELYISGRLKDMIIIHGVNYFPQDIEHTVSDCHPLVRKGNCAAFTTDENENLIIVCEVKPVSTKEKEIYSSLCNVIFNAVMLHHEISTHAIILVQPKSLQKTTSGKIRRRHVKEQMERNKLKVVYRWERI